MASCSMLRNRGRRVPQVGCEHVYLSCCCSELVILLLLLMVLGALTGLACAMHRRQRRLIEVTLDHAVRTEKGV